MFQSTFIIMSPNYHIYEIKSGKIVNGSCGVFINDIYYDFKCYNADEFRNRLGEVIQNLDYVYINNNG